MVKTVVFHNIIGVEAPKFQRRSVHANNIFQTIFILPLNLTVKSDEALRFFLEIDALFLIY
jgi:hypothetical protein